MMRSRPTTTGIKAFLSPGWVITTLLVVAFSYAAFTILSPWQLNKDAMIVSRNAHIEQAFKEAPQPYEEIFDASGAITNDQEWMRVSLTGHYLPDQAVTLRLRPVGGTPAYHSLTPFQLDSGPTILINRGFIPSKAGSTTVIPPAPTGETTIIAHARTNESVPSTQPMTSTQPIQVYGINTAQIAELIGADLGRDYAQLAEDQPGGLQTIPIPKLDRGNHLSYGFQWIAFGVMAPLGLGYFILTESKERRRAREEEEQMAQLASDHPSGPDPLRTDIPAEDTIEKNQESSLEDAIDRKMRSRYGDQKRNYYQRDY
ncbi:SURF1 family protein [Corynebacterium sp. ES2794-CONJ1]|uniref:SURF1 family cytochrome oxidase biogenesis protein n=1 Tax=Corynebacterium sp. ES2794-CONJ1 TaxID=2980553 RepID=UPI0021D9A3E5|nr:SURF1 family protein [Corynebacterium sp. ES2794-CONJ1]MCU9519815.1 SURF1 family protein [Corynebacterium sp. ES2794-CONJ1]